MHTLEYYFTKIVLNTAVYLADIGPSHKDSLRNQKSHSTALMDSRRHLSIMIFVKTIAESISSFHFFNI